MLLDLGRNRLAGTLPDTWGACGALCFEYLHYMCARARDQRCIACHLRASCHAPRLMPDTWGACGELRF